MTITICTASKFLSTLSLRRATHAPSHNLYLRNNFYPRSPCGERHNVRPETRQRDAISIHALLAESDPVCALRVTSNVHFYPRSPCGERLVVLHIVGGAGKFLSTLSLRRATVGAVHKLQCIHDFYPRSPCGERPLR